MYKKLLLGGLFLFVSQTGFAMEEECYFIPDEKEERRSRSLSQDMTLDEKLKKINLYYDPNHPFSKTKNVEGGGVTYDPGFTVDRIRGGVGRGIRNHYEYLSTFLTCCWNSFYDHKKSVDFRLDSSRSRYQLDNSDNESRFYLDRYCLEVIISGFSREDGQKYYWETEDEGAQEESCVRVPVTFFGTVPLFAAKNLLHSCLCLSNVTGQPGFDYDFTIKFEAFPEEEQLQAERDRRPEAITSLYVCNSEPPKPPALF